MLLSAIPGVIRNGVVATDAAAGTERTIIMIETAQTDPEQHPRALSHVSVHLNAAVLMMAEKATDMIAGKPPPTAE